MDKEGFIVYKSFYEPIKELSLDHKGLLLSAIFEYQINKKVIDLPIECRMAFKFFNLILTRKNIPKSAKSVLRPDVKALSASLKKC